MKSINKWLLLAFMKDGRTVHVGPFKTRSLAQFYAQRIEEMASYEAVPLIHPFD